jgi:FkbM family methyltransferase
MAYPYNKTMDVSGQQLRVVVHNEKEASFWNKYVEGKWEPQTLDFLVKNKRNGYFLDLGSWIGPISLLMSKHYEKVISVDFDPVALEHFKQNIEQNKIDNIETINVGLSNKKGSVRLNEDFFGSSETSLFYANEKEGREVKLIRFKELVDSIEKEKISFIKIDIEGGEFKILNDVYKFIGKNKTMVLVSYHPYHIGRRFNWKKFRVINSLKQLRFKKYIFRNGEIKVIKPFDILSTLKYKFPLGDVLES